MKLIAKKLEDSSSLWYVLLLQFCLRIKCRKLFVLIELVVVAYCND